jgi:predicted Holliday junction resolvase-like endonuclease
MTQGIRVTLGVLALCLIVLLLVVSKQMANSRSLRQEIDTVRHTLTTSQQQLEAAQALVQESMEMLGVMPPPAPPRPQGPCPDTSA